MSEPLNSQTLLWTVELAALFGLGLLWIAGWLKPRRAAFGDTLPAQWSLVPRRVFSRHERLLYERLREALPHCVLLSKLPLVRFCEPTDPAEMHHLHDLLGSNHVGFAICSAAGRVLATIDIESSRPNRHRGFRIKQAALDACGIPYLRCTAEPLPTVEELRAWATGLAEHALATPASENVVAQAPADAAQSVEARDAAPPLAPTAPFRPPRSGDERLARGNAGRFPELSTRRPDFAVFQDSFFAPDSRPHGSGGESGSGGVVVVDAPNPPLRGGI